MMLMIAFLVPIFLRFCGQFTQNVLRMVLPYELVRELVELMLWPAAVKEERERKPRLLCDHSWDWGWDSLNDTTVPHAPPEAMQFGNALPRILYHVRHADPKFGPVKASKHDVKDGFYRMFLRARPPAPRPRAPQVRRRTATHRHPHVFHDGLDAVATHVQHDVRDRL